MVYYLKLHKGAYMSKTEVNFIRKATKGLLKCPLSDLIKFSQSTNR